MSDILIKCTVCLCATLLLRYVSWSVCVCGWVCTGVFTCMSAPNEGLCAGICPTFQKGVCECEGVQCVQHVNSCWCLAVVQQEKLHIPSFCVCVCVSVALPCVCSCESVSVCLCGCVCLFPALSHRVGCVIYWGLPAASIRLNIKKRRPVTRTLWGM